MKGYLRAMTLVRRRVTSASALRALAHPLRMALLELLMAEGARTATQAAAALGESPSNCSWHLRKLAEHGFVRELTGGPGRNRPWRAVTEALPWDDGGPTDEDTRGEVLTDMVLEQELQRLRAARASAAPEPTEWSDATAVARTHAWLTADEATELFAAMTRLLGSWPVERTDDPSARPEGARLVSLVGWVAPRGPARRGGR